MQKGRDRRRKPARVYADVHAVDGQGLDGGSKGRESRNEIHLGGENGQDMLMDPCVGEAETKNGS